MGYAGSFLDRSKFFLFDSPSGGGDAVQASCRSLAVDSIVNKLLSSSKMKNLIDLKFLPVRISN
jgi:hypothetical protein